MLLRQDYSQLGPRSVKHPAMGHPLLFEIPIGRLYPNELDTMVRKADLVSIPTMVNILRQTSILVAILFTRERELGKACRWVILLKG